MPAGVVGKFDGAKIVAPVRGFGTQKTSKVTVDTSVKILDLTLDLRSVGQADPALDAHAGQQGAEESVAEFLSSIHVYHFRRSKRAQPVVKEGRGNFLSLLGLYTCQPAKLTVSACH